MQRFFKYPAESALADVAGSGDLVQCNRGFIILVNKSKGVFQIFDFFGVGRILFGAGFQEKLLVIVKNQTP